MVLLEAQACGKPVIAGDSGGTGEAISDGRTGYRVDCDSIPNLLDQITELLDERSAADAMGIAAQEWVEVNFGWDSLLAKARDVFLVGRDRHLAS